MPATKSLRSGTWASTLLATSSSARPCSATSSRAVARPKNATVVGMPRAIASSAVAVGSTPWTGMPRSANQRSK